MHEYYKLPLVFSLQCILLELVKVYGSGLIFNNACTSVIALTYVMFWPYLQGVLARNQLIIMHLNDGLKRSIHMLCNSNVVTEVERVWWHPNVLGVKNAGFTVELLAHLTRLYGAKETDQHLNNKTQCKLAWHRYHSLIHFRNKQFCEYCVYKRTDG